jgi:hypothetical protein
MAHTIQLLDFCKTGIKKVAQSFNLGAPLTAVTPVGLDSLGCQPLLSHRGDAGHEILSQIKQDKGSVVRQLLTTPNDSGFIGTFPAIQECLPYGGMIAGLRGAVPLPGTAVNPFPTTAPTTHLTWSVSGAAFAHTVNGRPQDLSGDPTAFDNFSGASRVGFGGVLGGASGANTLVQLPPDNREYTGGVRLRANHPYIPYLQLPYSPLLEPLLYQFDPVYGYFITPGWIGFGGDNGTCQVIGYAAPVTPCIITANGDFALPNSTEPNGPSLHRLYNLYRFSPFTMPGYGNDQTSTWDLSRTNLRGFLCVYVDSNRVDHVSLNGAGSMGSSGVTLPIPGSGPPSAFTPVFPGIAFDTIYQFDIVGNEATYSFNVTRGATTITTVPQALYNDGGTHIRCFEAYIDMAKSGNPALPCT